MRILLDELKENLNKVSKGGSNKSLQITFEANKLCFSMLMSTISTFTAMDVKCDDAPFDIMVDFTMLNNILRGIRSEYITLEKNNNVLLISTDPGENHVMMRMPIIQSNGKPDSKVGEEYVSKISVDNFYKYTNACVHAAATITSRDARMEAFYIEDAGNNKLRVTALDGYRVSIRDSLNGATPTNSIMVSAANMDRVAAMIGDNIKIAIPKSGRFVRVTGKNIVVVMPAVDGSYYNVDQMLNRGGDNPIAIKVNKDELLNAIRLAAIVDQKLILNISNSKISVSVNSTSGEIKCDVPFIGDKSASLQIGFNAKYLEDALKSLNSTIVEMNFTGAINPCKITSSWKVKKDGTESIISETEVVLPVRIKA